MRQRKPGVWEMRVYAGTDPITHRRVDLSRTVRGDQHDVEAAMSSFVAETEVRRATSAGRRTAPQRVTLDQLLAAHLGTRRRSPSKTSDQALVVSHIRPTIGSHPIDDVDTAMLDLLYGHLQTTAGVPTTTLCQIHGLLSAAFDDAARWGWIDRNPAAASARAPAFAAKPGRPRTRPLSNRVEAVAKDPSTSAAMAPPPQGASGAIVRLPDDFDPDGWEVEAKGWLKDVIVEFEGHTTRLAFYDPRRLVEEIGDELAAGRPVSFKNLVVVPHVTRDSIVAAVASLGATGDLSRLAEGT